MLYHATRSFLPLPLPLHLGHGRFCFASQESPFWPREVQFGSWEVLSGVCVENTFGLRRFCSIHICAVGLSLNHGRSTYYIQGGSICVI